MTMERSGSGATCGFILLRPAQLPVCVMAEEPEDDGGPQRDGELARVRVDERERLAPVEQREKGFADVANRAAGRDGGEEPRPRYRRDASHQHERLERHG